MYVNLRCSGLAGYWVRSIDAQLGLNPMEPLNDAAAPIEP